MNDKSQFIQRTESDDKSTRFYELREQGIRYIQELSGHLWTNFNTHDPGLILLETLCFAMTELGYKSNFSITDILQSVPNTTFQLPQNALYNAQEIFATHPITLTDYRMLLIDHLAPEINNVWVEMIVDSAAEFTGKYRVLLLPDNEIPIDEAQLIEKTELCMAAHRNLGEQLDEVQFLQRKRATITADIQLQDDASPDKVLAAFFYQLEEHYLNPTLKRFTEEELLQKGMSLDEIYSGPKTKYGHFDPEQFMPFPAFIEVEELTQVLFQIDEGVLKVDAFTVFLEGAAYTDKIPLAHFIPAFLATDPAHQIRCYQNGILLPSNASTIVALTEKRKQGQHRTYAISLQKQQQATQIGKRRNIAAMLPIEHDLPAVFGLGNQTLSRNASAEEIQQKQQLRAYLQIMNRFLENASHTLAHTAAFFSIDEKMFAKLYGKSYIHLPKTILKQRTLILDHLLARFNVAFPQYKEAQHTHAQLCTEIKVKEKCLQYIPELTGNRSAAANFNSSHWGTTNVATVCKWLHLFLGNRDFTVKSVTQSVAQLVTCIRKKNRHLTNIPVAEILQKAMHQQQYTITKNRKYFVVWLQLDGLKIYLGKRKIKEKAEQVIRTYCATAVKINTQSKRVFLIEDFMVDSEATFSVSLFFPDWTLEMQDIRFKEFIKTQAVEILPAHIHARFYALPYEEMEVFEAFYQELFKNKGTTINLKSQYKRYQF
ncbi:MAG: hypothetical protein AAF617_01605 [Bacteroidota bacterium]